MSAQRHQRRHHPLHERETEAAVGQAAAVDDNSAVIAQMGPAVAGPAPTEEGAGLAVDVPDWAADLENVEATTATTATATPDVAAEVDPAAAAALDGVIPPGLGLSLSASAGIALALSVSVGATLKVINQGNGILELEMTSEAGVGGSVGEGVIVGGEGNGESVSVGGEVTAGVARTWHLPFTQFLDPSVLATLVLAPLPDVLEREGIQVFRMPYVGDYMTSLEMAGFSITLLKLDDEMKPYLTAPCDVAAGRPF